MSNEAILTKVNNLFEEGQFSEVISIIESLPEEEKCYQMLFILASAYSELSDYEDEDRLYQQKAIKILNSIAMDGERDIKWLYLMGRIYFNSSLEEYAIEYFEKINRICSKDTDIAEYFNFQHFVNYCKECLHDRALAVIYTTFEEASKDKALEMQNIHDNHMELIFPKYNITICINISNLQRNGAKLEFETFLPDNKKDICIVEGCSHTYEKGITDALNKYILHFNDNFRHYLS